MIRIYTKELFAVLFLTALCLWSNQTIQAQCAAGEEEFEITLADFGFPPEVGWALYDDQDVEIASQGCGSITSFADQVTNVCLTPGDTYTFEAYDSFGDGWNGGNLSIENLDEACVIQDQTDITTTLSAAVPPYANICTTGFNPQLEFQYEFTPDAIEACTDPTATNYVPCAVVDDGSCIYPPPNDNCATAQAIPIQFGTCVQDILTTNVAATDATGMPNPTCAFYTGGDIWYSVVVPASGSVSVSMLSAGFPNPFDMSMQVYSGSCGSLSVVECDDFDGPGGMGQVNLTGQTPGETLYIMVWEDFNNSFGDFFIGAFEPPPGGSCETSFFIGNGGADLPFEDLGVSTTCFGDTYPGTICGVGTFGDSEIVYSFAPTDDIVIDITLSNTSDGVRIFVMDECPDVNANACVDQIFNFAAGETSLQGVELDGGTTYYIMIQGDGFPDNLQNFDLLIEENIPLTCDDPLVGIGVNIALNFGINEIGWEIVGTELGAECGTASSGIFEACLDPNVGDYTFNAYDSFGDGWDGGGSYLVEIITGPDAGCILGFGVPDGGGELSEDLPSGVSCPGFNPQMEDQFVFNLNDLNCITGFDCSTATVLDPLDLPYVETPGGGLGTTCGFGDDYGPTDAPCGSTNFTQEEDKIYSITPVEDMVVNIELDIVTGFNDPGMFIYDGCPDESTTNCIDFTTGFNTDLEILELVLFAGTTYYIQLDHVNSFFNCYNFTLTIEEIPCGSEAGSPIAPNQQICMVADETSDLAIPDPAVPFVQSEAVAVNPPADAFLVGADDLAYNYLVTDLSDGSSLVGVSADGVFSLPNVVGTNYCFSGVIYDPLGVDAILCDPANADFFSSKEIGCGATFEQFLFAIDPTNGVSPYTVSTVADALNGLCNLLPGECDLCYESVVNENTYCVGVFNCEDINCGTVNPTYVLPGTEPICEADSLSLDANYVLVDKEVEGINFILTWYENGEQVAQTGAGEDGVYGTGDEVLVEEYTHPADHATDNCTAVISSNEYEVELSCIGKTFDVSTYSNIVTGYFAPPTGGTEFLFNFAAVPLQATAQNLLIDIEGQAINFAEAADARVSIFAPDGSDADNDPDLVVTLNGAGGTGAAWSINEVLTEELANAEVVAGIWTVVVFDGDFVENGGFPVPEGIVTSIEMTIDWIATELPVTAEEVGSGDTIVDIYDTAQDGIDFDLPEGCAGEIAVNCPNVIVEYSLDGGQSWSANAPDDLNIGDSDLIVEYRAFVDGVPSECGVFGTYTMTCPCQADACNIITNDNTLVFCTDDEIDLDIVSGNLTEINDFGGDFLATGLTHIRCGGSTFGNYPYEAFEFQVSQDGDYTITTSWLNSNGFLNLYEGSFTPLNNATSCSGRIAFDDDFPGFDGSGSQIENVGLETGTTYILVYTTDSGFGGQQADGTYTSTFEGPGDILTADFNCADPAIYGSDYLITNLETDQIIGVGLDAFPTMTNDDGEEEFVEGLYTVCGFSYINGVTDPATLINTSYSALLEDADSGNICADLETAPTCMIIAISPDCDTGNCPGFVDAIAQEENLCQGEPGVFEALLTNADKWAVASITDELWEFNDDGFNGNFAGNTQFYVSSAENNAVYFNGGQNNTPDEASVTSPPINLEGLTEVTFSIDVNFQQSGFFNVEEEFEINFLNPNTGQWDNQQTLTADTPGGCFGNPAACTATLNIDVDPLYYVNGFRVQLVFTDSGIANNNGMGFDNVVIIDQPEPEPDASPDDPAPPPVTIFSDDFELGNATYAVTWTDPDGISYSGIEAEIPLFLEGNLGNTCIPEPKEVSYVVTCLDTGELVEEGIVVVEVFPNITEGIHYELPDEQGCELELVTNCGSQGGIEVLYSATGLLDSFTPEIPTNLNPGEAQSIFYQVNIENGPQKCAAIGVYTATCPFECPNIVGTDIPDEICGNSLTLFSVEADVPFAETSVNGYSGTNIGRPLWTRPIGTGPSVTLEDVPFDIFAFEVPSSGFYEFDVTFNGFNGYLHLYEGDFDPTAPFDNLIDADDGVGSSASIDGNLEADVVYYLAISGNNPTEVGSFSIDISGSLDFVIQKVPTTEVVWSYNAEQYASGFPTPIRLNVNSSACGQEEQPLYYSVQCTALGAGIYFDIAKVTVYTALQPNVDFAIPDTYQDSNEVCSSALSTTQCPEEIVEFKYSTNPNGPFTDTPPVLASGTGIVVYYTANLLNAPAGCGISGDSYIVSCPNCPTFNEATASQTTMCTNTDVDFEADIEDGLLQVQGTVNSISGTNVGGPLINLGFIFGTSPYDVFIFTVPISGAYIINQVQDFDGIITLYANNFDASAPDANEVFQNDNSPSGGIGTSEMAVQLSAGTIYYLVSSGHADPFGFFSDGSGFEGNFQTTFTPGVSPFLQVYDLQWLYGFQGSNSDETTFTIINDQSCGVDKQNVTLEVVCRGSGEVIADELIEFNVYPVLSPLVNFFIPDPSGIAPGIPDQDSCSVNLIFDLCEGTDSEVTIEYSLDETTFEVLSEDDPTTLDIDESYTIHDLFSDQTPVDNPGTDFDLPAKNNAILAEGEAALIFFDGERVGAPNGCNAISGFFRQICIDGSDSACPNFNFATVNGVDTPETGEACANTLATFSIDIDFLDIPALAAPNYSTQWFGPNGEQPNPLDRLSLEKTYAVRSNSFCEVIQDSATVVLDCVSSFPGETALQFPKVINIKVDIFPLPPANPADFLTFTTDGCKGIIIEELGCDPVGYVALAEPDFPLAVNEVGTAIYELTWDGGPCCDAGVELNRISDGSFEVTPPGIPLPNWNTQYLSSDAPTLQSSFHLFLPHCDNLTCNGGGSPLQPAPNVTGSSSGDQIGKDFDLWGYLWFGGLGSVELQEFASQGLRVPVNAEEIEFRFLNNSCSTTGPDFDYIELQIDGQQIWVQTTDPDASDDQSAPCFGGYQTITVDITDWADGFQHIFTFHGQFYGNGGITNFGIDDVTMNTNCDYSDETALVEVPYSCLCGEPLTPLYGGASNGCGSVTYILPTSIPVDNDELAVFTWTDFDTGEVIPAGQEFTLEHPGGCSEALRKTFVVEVTCSEDPDFSELGGSYTVAVYPEITAGLFSLPSADNCSPVITFNNDCAENPFDVLYSTDNVNFSLDMPADLEGGTSQQFWYEVRASGSLGVEQGDCSVSGTYEVVCTECPFPVIVGDGIDGDRCGNDLGISAEIDLTGTEVAPSTVEWLLNGESTGVTGTVYDGNLPSVSGCGSVKYNLTAQVTCSLDDAVFEISAGDVTVYGLPEEGEDFTLPDFCEASLGNICDGLNVSYSINGLPVEGEPADVANGAIVAYTLSVDGAPEGCATTGFYFYNCPECADVELAAGIDGNYCNTDVDLLSAISISGGINTVTSCEWFINGETTGFVGFVYQSTISADDISEPTSYDLSAVCTCDLGLVDPAIVNAGSVVVYPAPVLNAVSEQDMSICSGDVVDLAVSIQNVDPSDVQWTNSAGEAIGVGTSITTDQLLNTTDCNGILETVTATVAGGTVPSCEEAQSVEFIISVQPDPLTNVNVIETGCAVSLSGVCDNFTVVHKADDGPLVLGSTFLTQQPDNGMESGSVVFTITSVNGCGNTTISVDYECEAQGDIIVDITGNIFTGLVTVIEVHNDGGSTGTGGTGGGKLEPNDCVIVSIYSLNGNLVATTITDDDGNFNFSVPPGTYYVVVDLSCGIAPPPGYTASGQSPPFTIDGEGNIDVLEDVTPAGCIGNPGFTTPASMEICSGQTVEYAANNFVAPTAGGYVHAFVLHTNEGPFILNMVDANETGIFGGNLETGTYYISSVVGPDDGSGMPDMNDPCTVIAPGSVLNVSNGGFQLTGGVTEETLVDYTLNVGVGGGTEGETYTITVLIQDADFVDISSNTYTFTSGDEVIAIPDIPINTWYFVTIEGENGCSIEANDFIQDELVVELLDFSGEVLDNGNVLNWITSTEINNDFFTLYHSTDKVNFEVVSVVDGAGNSSTANSYNFLHREAPNGVNYYRLDQTDFDGTTTSSNVISLVRGEGDFGIVEVLPVPARDFVNLTFTSKEDAVIEGQLHSVSGKVLATFKVNAINGINTIRVDVGKYPIGVYLLTINNGEELLSTKVIKE